MTSEQKFRRFPESVLQETILTPAPPKPTRSGDPYTLRAKGGEEPTDARGLATSILHVLAQNEEGTCKVQSVGPKALNIVMTAFRMASEVAERRTQGAVLVMRQSEYDAEIGGNKAKGVCTRIFSIPIKYAI